MATFRDIQEEKSLTALAHRAQQGCRVSFARLVDRLGGRLLRFFEAKTRCLADAEDLVQETFLKAYRHLDRYDAARPFSTWLFAIAWRTAADFHRRRLAHKETSLPDQASKRPGPLDTIIEQEEHIRLWRSVQKLPGKQQDALWLFYAEQMSVADIAAVMQLNRLHVRVLLYRGRAGLARQLGAAGKVKNNANDSQQLNSQKPPRWEAAPLSTNASQSIFSSREVKV